jgi:retinol dehydrogenase-12
VILLSRSALFTINLLDFLPVYRVWTSHGYAYKLLQHDRAISRSKANIHRRGSSVAVWKGAHESIPVPSSKIMLTECQVYVVTGSNSGIGKELVKILYAKNAKVYMLTRSREKTMQTIAEIMALSRSSQGELLFVPFDLTDLDQVRRAADEVKSQETKLHTLFNNAGVGIGSFDTQTTSQGHDLWLGVNCVGPQLLTQLLTPCLIEAAKSEPAGSIRVVWVSSASGELPDVPWGGVPMEQITEVAVYQAKYPISTRYGISRAGNILQAAHFAQLYEKEGIISYAMHPGIVNTDSFTPLAKTSNIAYIFKILFMQPAIYGAYTELFTGLSPEVVSCARLGDWGKCQRIRGNIANVAHKLYSSAVWSYHEQPEGFESSDADKG